MSNPSNFPLESEFVNARDFLNELRITNEAWSIPNQWNSNWIFRGQSDASWPLIPSAWRQSDQNADASNALSFINHYKTFDWLRLKIGLEDTLKEYWIDHKPDLNNLSFG